MTDQPTFQPGDQVDIVIRRAEVTTNSEGEISFALPGVEQELYALPVVNDRGEPLPAVGVTPSPPETPGVRQGDVWCAKDGLLFFGVLAFGGHKVLLANSLGELYEPAALVEQAGQLELVCSENVGVWLDDEPDGRPALFTLPPRADAAQAGGADPPTAAADPAGAAPYEEVTGPLGPPNPSDAAFGAFSPHQARALEASPADGLETTSVLAVVDEPVPEQVSR